MAYDPALQAALASLRGGGQPGQSMAPPPNPQLVIPGQSRPMPGGGPRPVPAGAGAGILIGPPVPGGEGAGRLIGPPVTAQPEQGAAPNPDVNPHFAQRMQGLAQAVKQSGGELYPFSLARTADDQQELYRSAIQKYGDEKTAAQYVSPPGKSHHETTAGIRYGLGPGAIAADLRGDLAIAHRLAPMFGLEFGDKNNPWHVSIAGL